MSPDENLKKITLNQRVAGSIPAAPTNHFLRTQIFRFWRENAPLFRRSGREALSLAQDIARGGRFLADSLWLLQSLSGNYGLGMAEMGSNF